MLEKTSNPTTTTTATGQELPVQPTLDAEQKKWVSVLTRARQVSVKAILDLGEKLIKAKKELVAKDGHGRWLPVLEAAGFNERIAELHMKVARHHVLNNHQNVISLPPSVSTLAALADIPDATLTGSIESGKVNSRTTREEAKAMKPKPEPKPEVVLPALDEATVDQVIPLMEYIINGSTSDVLATTHYLLGELAEMVGGRDDTEEESKVLVRAKDVISNFLKAKVRKGKKQADSVARKTKKSAKAKGNKKKAKAGVAQAVADLMAAEKHGGGPQLRSLRQRLNTNNSPKPTG